MPSLNQPQPQRRLALPELTLKQSRQRDHDVGLVIREAELRLRPLFALLVAIVPHSKLTSSLTAPDPGYALYGWYGVPRQRPHSPRCSLRARNRNHSSGCRPRV